MSKELLSCTGLNIQVPGLQLVRQLDIQVRRHEMLCIIGGNGAGKTTLLHTLAGLQTGTSAIRYAGTPLAQLPRREIAKFTALLLQRHEDAFPTTVYECVAAARYPHSELFGWDTSGQDAEVDNALRHFQLQPLAGRDVRLLSGGERQRVALASTLAQQPRVYLLDEPLNNLDPRHQLGVMQVLRRLCDTGAAVVAVMHDLNFVAQFADRVLMLFGPERGDWYCDSGGVAMDAGRLSELYQTTIACYPVDGRRLFVVQT